MKTIRKQSLAQALKLIRSGTLRIPSLDGLPPGGWAQTAQAMRGIVDEIPAKEARSYTLNELVDALYRVDARDRYARREES